MQVEQLPDVQVECGRLGGVRLPRVDGGRKLGLETVQVPDLEQRSLPLRVDRVLHALSLDAWRPLSGTGVRPSAVRLAALAAVGDMTAYDRPVRRDVPLADLGDFLALPLVAVLATYRRDGDVLLSPVWHRWHDDGFDVTTYPTDIKVRHLQNDPRASLLIYDQQPPLRGVEIRTTATLSTLEDLDVLRDLAARYLGEEAAEPYVASVTGELILIRLEPGHVRTWDFADEF